VNKTELESISSHTARRRTQLRRSFGNREVTIALALEHRSVGDITAVGLPVRCLKRAKMLTAT
jgi:hypothetical protein